MKDKHYYQNTPKMDPASHKHCEDFSIFKPTIKLFIQQSKLEIPGYELNNVIKLRKKHPLNEINNVQLSLIYLH